MFPACHSERSKEAESRINDDFSFRKPAGITEKKYTLLLLLIYYAKIMFTTVTLCVI